MRVHLLEVAGMGHGGRPIRYYSGNIPPPPKFDPVTTTTYLDVPGIIDASTVGGAIDPRGGIREVDPVVITIVTGRRRPRGSVDAGTLFNRHGPRSAPGGTQLARTMRQADDVAYTVTDPTGLGMFPAVVQINREAVEAAAAAGDGTDGNPWRLTGLKRGAWGTVAATHFVDEASSTRPHILGRCVIWKTRRAIVYEAEIYGRGPAAKMGTLREVTRGFLEAKPIVKGNSVEVEVIPNAGHVDRVMTAGAPTFGLAHGWHYFDGITARYLAGVQGFSPGAGWQQSTNAVSLDGAQWIRTQSDRHAAVMDVSLDEGHPRRGTAEVIGAVYEVDGYTVAPDPDALTLSIGQPQGDIQANVAVGNPDVNEALDIDFTGPNEVLKRWPIDLYDKVNSPSGWMPSDHTGQGGQWADMAIVDAQGGGHGLRVRRNVPALRAVRLIFSNRSGWPAGAGPRSVGQRHGGDLAPSTMGGPQAMTYGVDFAQPGETSPDYFRLIEVDRDTEAGAPVRIRGVAAAFYQETELYITANGDLGAPLGTSWAVDITHTDHAGEERVETIDIAASAPALDGDDDPVEGVWTWRIPEHLRPAGVLPSFGDWPDRPRVRMSPTIQMVNRPTAEVMLRLLTSNGGGLADGNGAFDRDAFGAGMPLEDIDVESFTAFPWTFSRWSIKADDEATLGDLIKPILMANCAALTMGNIEGRSVVRIVKVGVEDAQPVSDLTDADWLIRPAPEDETDDEIVNVVEFKANYGTDDKPATNVIRRDGPSIEAYGEAKKLTIEARGLSLPAGVPPEQAPEIRDAQARIFFNLNAPRRVWTATTSSAVGRHLNLGDVVRVTSKHLTGFSDREGVTGALARIISIRRELRGEGCALRMTHSGARVGGWAPAMDMLEVIDATTVRVSINAYSRQHAPGGARQYDIDFYAVGENNVFEPRSDNDSAFDLPPVANIDRDTHRMTFTAPHGIAPGARGVIVFCDWDQASARQRTFAYFADDDGLLDGVPGFVIA